SVERMDILDIQNTASTDFYSAIKNMNGVDFSTQSLTFKSVNARGFGANGNTRFVQLIDGIDNQAPGLNFPVGNVVGISELDLESVELIPGAASALYGPNAIQGILLMNSKSPFDYQGLDFYTKLGVNNIGKNDDDASLYKDIGFRYAKAWNNKLAIKLTASWLNAQDFYTRDYRDQSFVALGGTVEGNPNSNRENNRFYDGVNVYGDFALNIPEVQPVFSSLFTPGSLEGVFSPTGFRENEFVDNTTESLKFGTALHYRINDKLEISGQYNIGFGSSVYTANDRFVLDGFSIWTGKLELRGSNFYLRAYTTQEDSGDTYAANTVASRITQEFYIPDYIGAYLGARGGGADNESAHGFARGVADGYLQNGGNGHAPYFPGSPLFNQKVDSLRSLSIADGGALFLDRSDLYHYEGSYNFKNQIDWADIVIGANFRTYAMESEGTLFTLDENGEEISYNEYGGYIQIRKDILDNVSLTASGRYDKNENFKGQFTPRIAAVWEFADGHNLRGSYQTGFRIPTTQDQFIDLDVVSRRLIGRNQLLRDFYNIDTNPVYTTSSVQAGAPEIAEDVYKEYLTEKVATWEVGYKGLWLAGALFIDAFYYQSTYNDLLAEIDVRQLVVAGADLKSSAAIPDGSVDIEVALVNGLAGHRTQRYGYNVNFGDEVKTSGFGLGAEYSLGGGYTLGGNISQNKMQTLDDLVAQEYNVAFNTPEWRYNLKFGNRKLTDKLGFNVTYRWQEAYLWQSSIGSGVIPAYGTVDAQVSYDIPSMKAKLKLGGSNITNKRYTTSFANPRLGAIYYIQLNLNNLLN
ncbi:MAG: TonB-dependent receptor, partial [Cyclobacteriaceae bacterium]